MAAHPPSKHITGYNSANSEEGASPRNNMTLNSQSFNDFKIFTYICLKTTETKHRDVELMWRGFAMFGAVNVYW